MACAVEHPEQTGMYALPDKWQIAGHRILSKQKISLHSGCGDPMVADSMA